MPVNDAHELAELRAEVARLRAALALQGETHDEELDAVFASVPVALFVLDAERRIIRFRAGSFPLLMPPGEFLGRRVTDVLPPEVCEQLEQRAVEAALTGTWRAFDYDLVVPAPEGPKASHYTAQGVSLSDGGTAVLVSDTTDQYRVAQELQASERRFRALTEHATDILYVLDAQLRVIFWSPGAVEALGWTAEEALGHFGPDWVHPEDRATVSAPPPPGVFGVVGTFSYRVLHKHGGWRHLEAKVRDLLGDPAVGGIVVNARDVTERKRLEARSEESRKLESIGRLAGGIAHDFNNLLTVILGCGELALEELEVHPGARELLREVLTAGERARDLTRQLLAFARKQVISPVLLDLNRAVLDNERMVRRLMGEDIELTVSLSSAPCHVMVDPAQLHQVLVNLAANARDVLPRGGHLSISTRCMCDRPLGELFPDVRSGQYMRLVVTDDGPGIPADIRAHIFEPFFTTKAVGEGTGLGLATVYGIVNQSGGHIAVECPPEGGTRFHILLPCADPPPNPSGPEPAPQLLRGQGHILLVEDDHAVAQITARVLRDAGYDVQVAARGADALALVAAGTPVDLLVCDVVMPGLDGRQVADAVIAARPEARVLFISGFPQETLSHHGVVDEGLHLLAKPFTPRVLLARVAERLAGAGRPRAQRSQ